MEDRDLRPRTGLPLPHILSALLIAAIAGGSCWLWLSRRPVESSAAVLSFDNTAAQSLDANLATSSKPAVAFANSILSDQMMTEMARGASLSSSTDASRVEELRAGLELTQDSPERLKVQFRSSDPGRSAANANVVAQALAAYAPPAENAPAASGPQPAATPAAAKQDLAQLEGQSQPGKTKHKTQQQTQQKQSGPKESQPSQSQAKEPARAAASTDQSLADSLGDIGAQLTAADREMDRLASGESARRAYVKFDQQQLLKSRVNAAENKLDDLRAQYGQGDAAPAVKEGLATVKQVLGAILHTGAGGFASAGTSASQLSRERSELVDAVAVIQRERQKIAQTESAQAGAGADSRADSTPAASLSAPASASAQPSDALGAPSPGTSSASSAPEATQPSAVVASSSPQAAPADSGNPPPQQTSKNPLSIVKLASPVQTFSPLLAILAGLGCGLLYLGGAALAGRRGESDEDYEQESLAPRRFITPDEPAYLPREEVRAAKPQGWIIAPAEDEETHREPQFVAFGATDENAAARREAAPKIDEKEGSADTRQETVVENERTSVAGAREEKIAEVREEPDGSGRAEPLAETREEPTVESRGMPVAGTLKEPAVETREEPVADTRDEPVTLAREEPVVESHELSRDESEDYSDPFMAELLKSLSQTSIGRMLERNGDEGAGTTLPENPRPPRERITH